MHLNPLEQMTHDHQDENNNVNRPQLTKKAEGPPVDVDALDSLDESFKSPLQERKDLDNNRIPKEEFKELDIKQHIKEIKYESKDDKSPNKIQNAAEEEPIIDKKQFNRMQRFIGGETPKTYTNAFGSLDVYLSFFENRAPEMMSFVSVFQKAETNQDIGSLSKDIVPLVIDCIKKEASKLKKNGVEKNLVALFPNIFSSFEEFYGTVIKAYTMETFLYEHLNKYLRNEDWPQLDELLPYAFCLCKAFQCSKLTSTCNKSLQQLFKDNQNNSLSSLILYRGAVFDEASLSCYLPEIVSTFSWNAVTSTSRNLCVAEVFSEAYATKTKIPVIFMIEVSSQTQDSLKNLNIIDIKTLSEAPDEDEIILAPGSIFELLSFTRDKKRAQIRLRLISDASVLPLQGKIMPGTMHVQISKGKAAKIICQEGRELIEALQHLRGNRMIEELELRLCKYDESSLKVFTEVMPTLPKLAKLNLFSILSDETNPLETLFEAIKKLKISSIEIDNRLFDRENYLDLFLREIRQLKSLSSLKIDFNHTERLEETCLKKLATGEIQSVTHLETLILDFKQDKRITPEEVKSLCSEGFRHFTSLTTLTLNFEKCRQITDDGVKSLCSEGLRHLTLLTTLTLNFDGRFGFTDEGVKSLCSEGLKYLTSLRTLTLNLTGCYNLTDKAFKTLGSEGLRYLTSLITLTLIVLEFNPHITDEGVNSLCSEGLRYLTSLTTLTLQFIECNKITDQGVKYLSSGGLLSLTSLKTLNLGFVKCLKITDDGVKTLCSEGLRYLTSISNLALDFENSAKITDKGVESLCSDVLRHLTSIRILTLVFRSCQKITDEGMKILCSEGLRNLPSLRILTLDFELCRQITDEGVRSLCTEGLRYFTSLASLTLIFENCQITDNGLKFLCSEGLPYLTSLTTLALNFQFCDKITDEGVKSLCSEGLPYLTSLTTLTPKFNGCRISQDGSNYFQTQTCMLNISIISSQPALIGWKVLNLTRKSNLYARLSNDESPSICKDNSLSLDSASAISNFYSSYLETGTIKLLKTLNISETLFQSGFSLEQFQRMCSKTFIYLTSLTTLNLDFGYWKGLTDEGMKSLCSGGLKYLASLTNLTLYVCMCNITDIGLGTLGSEGLRYLPSLATLTLEFPGCPEITDIGLGTLGSEGLRYLTSLKNLTLNFGGSQKITDEGLKSLCSNGLRYLTSLTTLTLEFSECLGITDIGLGTLGSEGLRHLTLLKNLTLNFGRSDQITDKGVRSLCLQGLRYMASLTTLTLDFEMCYFFTDEGIKSLCLGGLRYLTSLTTLSLEFGSCQEITDEGVKSLCFDGLRHLSSLTTLNLGFGRCNQISEYVLKDILMILNYFQFSESDTDFTLSKLIQT